MKKGVVSEGRDTNCPVFLLSNLEYIKTEPSSTVFIKQSKVYHIKVVVAVLCWCFFIFYNIFYNFAGKINKSLT